MRKIWGNMKIHKKLMLSYLMACILPLIAVSLIIYSVSAKSLEETSLEFASVFSSQIVSNIDDFIDEYDRVTKSVLVDNDVIYSIDNDGEITIMEQVNQQLYLRKVMMRLMTLKPEIKSIALLTSNNQLFQFSSNGDSISQEELKNQEWLRQMLASKDKLAITSVHDRSYYDNNRDGIVLTIGRQMLDYSGAYAGVLLIDLEPSSLIQLSKGFLLARNHYNIKISVTDSKGGVLYDSDVASGRLTWDEVNQGENAFLYKKNPADFIIMSNQTNRNDLNVNAIIPRSDLLFKINKIGYVTGVAVAICVAIVIIISFLLSRTITKPIQKLQRRMEQMEEGEYKLMIQDESKDEIGSLVTSYNHMAAKIKSLIEEVYIAEIKQKNAKFLALQTQINPHMLYNTLEAIRMKALVNGAEEIADMIKILARMFRMALNNRTAPHQIKDEIEYAENYMKLQNMRFPDSFYLEVSSEENIMEGFIISLILQPILENSIEHGFKGYQTKLHMKINGKMAENQDIILQVSDDGKGMSEERVVEINSLISMAKSDKLRIGEGQGTNRTSIGLKNIAERIKLQYGVNYYLKVITSNEYGTIVEIRIPGQWNETKK